MQKIYLVLWNKGALGVSLYLKDCQLPIIETDSIDHIEVIKNYLNLNGFIFNQDNLELSYPFTDAISYSIKIDEFKPDFSEYQILDALDELAIYPEQLSAATVFFMQKFTKKNVKS